MSRIRAGLVIFIVLFSLQGFSQTTESEHPLLDKYYPQLQKTKIDTNRTITNQIKQEPQIKSVPAATNISVPAAKPMVTTTIIQADTTSKTPSVTTTTVPSVTTTPAINNTKTDVTSVPPLTTKVVINKPDSVTAKMPVQQITPPQPAPIEMYMDTRLGSSTPQYDTWEKNNNGAGAVTTSPK